MESLTVHLSASLDKVSSPIILLIKIRLEVHRFMFIIDLTATPNPFSDGQRILMHPAPAPPDFCMFNTMAQRSLPTTIPTQLLLNMLSHDQETCIIPAMRLVNAFSWKNLGTLFRCFHSNVPKTVQGCWSQPCSLPLSSLTCVQVGHLKCWLAHAKHWHTLVAVIWHLFKSTSHWNW